MIEDTKDGDSTIYREPINYKFVAPVGQEDGAIGVIIEHEGAVHAQYCHYGDFNYQSCKIYEDYPTKTKEAIDRMAHSSELWSLCNNARSLSLCDKPLPFKAILRFVLSWNMINR